MADQVLDQVVPLGPDQVPEGFIVTLMLQGTMVQILSYFQGLAQTEIILAVPATSQAGGEAQTPATLEQAIVMFQTSRSAYCYGQA